MNKEEIDQTSTTDTNNKCRNFLSGLGLWVAVILGIIIVVSVLISDFKAGYEESEWFWQKLFSLFK